MSFSLTGYIVRDEAFLAHMHLVVFVSINLVISYFTKPSLVLAFIYHVHSLSFSTISILLANKVMLVRKKNTSVPFVLNKNIMQKTLLKRKSVGGLHDSGCKSFPCSMSFPLDIFWFLLLVFFFHKGFFEIPYINLKHCLDFE